MAKEARRGETIQVGRQQIAILEMWVGISERWVGISER
jgi:hypothetical protein